MTMYSSFGVGCFHFGVKKSPPFNFEFSEYLKQVENFLKAISNISNIEINSAPENAKLSPEVTEDILLSIELDTFPCPLFLEIQFEIYIPFRIQEQLKVFPSIPSIENFKIWIFYTYYCPVTFIELIESSEDDNPSDAVAIVREFLKAQNEKVSSDYIEFQCLGPSPFHADFFIESSTDENSTKFGLPFWSEQHVLRGYDRIKFFFDSQMFQEPIDAKDFIFSKIQDELGLFYRIIQINNLMSALWENANEKLDRIINLEEIKGFKGAFKRYFSTSQLNEAFISIAEFERTDLFLRQGIQNDYKDMLRESDLSPLSLQSYLEKQIQERVNYPVRQLADLVNLFENRREKQFELLIVLFSAILGGIFGALITILLSRSP